MRFFLPCNGWVLIQNKLKNVQEIDNSNSPAFSSSALQSIQTCGRSVASSVCRDRPKRHSLDDHRLTGDQPQSCWPRRGGATNKESGNPSNFQREVTHSLQHSESSHLVSLKLEYGEDVFHTIHCTMINETPKSQTESLSAEKWNHSRGISLSLTNSMQVTHVNGRDKGRKEAYLLTQSSAMMRSLFVIAKLCRISFASAQVMRQSRGSNTRMTFTFSGQDLKALIRREACGDERKCSEAMQIVGVSYTGRRYDSLK